MQSRVEKKTIRRTLNKLFRVSKRKFHRKIETGVHTTIETYKNKEVITVSTDIKLRFNFKI